MADERDDDYFKDDDPGEECGRWSNGRLMSYYSCGLAGTEWCDWECPYSRPPQSTTAENTP